MAQTAQERRKAAYERLRRRSEQKAQDRRSLETFRTINFGTAGTPVVGAHPLSHFNWWKAGFAAGQSDGPLDYTHDPVDLWGNQKKLYD